MYLYFLKKFKKKYAFFLYAYCLMPNHVHLIGEPQDISLLSRFMHALNRTYTLYFNNRHSKVGHLWQGRYKSKIIAKDKYLLDCLNYVEQNPVRGNLAKNAVEYPWNSYKERLLKADSKMIDGLPAF
jgi:putative transposase